MRTLALTILLFVFSICVPAQADQTDEYLLSPGDTIRVSVFQSPEMTTEARLSGTGKISFPLIGSTQIGGLSVPEAESRIAKQLKDKGYVNSPNISIMLIEARGSQVSVLGHVNKPGRYPLDVPRLRASDLIAAASGVSESGGDTVVIVGTRNGLAFRQEVKLSAVFSPNSPADNPLLAPGDTLFVRKAPVFYIYGEVQKAGTYRVDANMTVMQAVAAGGGMTPRGTIKGLRVYRRSASGEVAVIEPRLDALLQEDDVVQVREALF